MNRFALLGLLTFGCSKPADTATQTPDRPTDSGAPFDDYEGDEAGECTDGEDNDGNGQTDCDDDGCASGPDCNETDENADTAEPDPEPPVAPAASRLSPRDYGYLFWPGNHWTTWGSFDNTHHVQTGHYGMAIDVTRASIDHLGVLRRAITADEALTEPNTIITDLPPSSTAYSVRVGGGPTHVATQFLSRDGSPSNPSELVDMGRYMQRIDIPVVQYAGTDLQGSVHIAAMTRHAVLTHAVTPESAADELAIRLELSGDAVAGYTDAEWLDGDRAVALRDEEGHGWTFIAAARDGSTGTITRFPDGTLRFEHVHTAVEPGERVALSVTAVPSTAGGDDQVAVWLDPEATVTGQSAQLHRDGSDASAATDAEWDPERGLYAVDLQDMTAIGGGTWPSVWSTPSNHTWYNRHRIAVTNSTDTAVSVPIGFNAGENAAFYITGGSPMLRSMEGEPWGVPVQISKNWHDPPAWFHMYAAPLLPPGTHEFEHTFAHSKWGEAYAVQHAQLSLIGWGHNQQWDESSIGCWGESITYDPDLTLARSQVDDVRPFLVDAGGEWRWTGNVGGASFLVYRPAEGIRSFPSHQLGRMRTHYRFTGPNLTDVVYAGLSRDGKIEAVISAQLGRTDDLVRAYYHLDYTVLEDVHYTRLALFQIAADRYSDNGFARYAYGDAVGTLFDGEVFDHVSTGYVSDADRGIPMTGDAPWVMLYQNERTGDALPEHYANIGFVVRDYEAIIGGATITTPHINLVRTHNGGWSQMGFELGIPYDGDPTIPAGSTIRATVEYLVPPADKDRYYGEADYLLAMAAADYPSTEMMRTLAADNALDVEAEIGRVDRVHPVELTAESGTTAVQFNLTGGLGYTPVTIRGLARPNGWQLEQRSGDAWEAVDQSVEGNDYWQAYDDAASASFALVFNLHNRGTQTYRLVRR